MEEEGGGGSYGDDDNDDDDIIRRVVLNLNPSSVLEEPKHSLKLPGEDVKQSGGLHHLHRRGSGSKLVKRTQYSLLAYIV